MTTLEMIQHALYLDRLAKQLNESSDDSASLVAAYGWIESAKGALLERRQEIIDAEDQLITQVKD